MITQRKTSPIRKSSRKSTRRPGRKWSAHVTATSDALTLEPHIFTQSASAIAQSVKRSADRSHRRKSSPLRSAMSMLTFYENRAGKNLSPAKRKKIDAAKNELRKLFKKNS